MSLQKLVESKSGRADSPTVTLARCPVNFHCSSHLYLGEMEMQLKRRDVSAASVTTLLEIAGRVKNHVLNVFLPSGASDSGTGVQQSAGTGHRQETG